MRSKEDDCQKFMLTHIGHEGKGKCLVHQMTNSCIRKEIKGPLPPNKVF